MQAASEPLPPNVSAGLTDDECLRRIHCILPDVSTAYVSNAAQTEREQHGHCSADWCNSLIARLLDIGDYPKQSLTNTADGKDVGGHRSLKRAASTVFNNSHFNANQHGYGGGNDAKAAVTERFRTSPSRESRSPKTEQEHFDRLRREFPRLAARKIRSALAGKSLFDAYVHLYHYAQEMVEQGKMLPNPRDKTNVSRRPESGSGPDVVILAAMEYVKNSAGKGEQDDIQPAKKRRTRDHARHSGEVEKAAEKPTEPPNDEWLCDTASNAQDMVTCNGSRKHTYCHGCMNGQVRAELEKRNPRIRCFMHAACQAPFLAAQLAACIDAGQLRRLAELEQDAEIAAAGLDNMHRCPACNFRAQCPPLDENSQFDCPSCRHASCRLCLKPPHRPLTCAESEAKQMREDRAKMVHAVHEAMTEALVRRCNKCGTRFVKEDGCNKMRCPKAGCKNQQCYICGANIMNYSHFGPRSCPLYDNEVPLHMRHEREVREAEAEAVARLRAKHPEIPEAEYKGTKNGKK